MMQLEVPSQAEIESAQRSLGVAMMRLYGISRDGFVAETDQPEISDDLIEGVITADLQVLQAQDEALDATDRHTRQVAYTTIDQRDQDKATDFQVEQAKENARKTHIETVITKIDDAHTRKLVTAQRAQAVIQGHRENPTSFDTKMKEIESRARRQAKAAQRIARGGNFWLLNYITKSGRQQIREANQRYERAEARIAEVAEYAGQIVTINHQDSDGKYQTPDVFIDF